MDHPVTASPAVPAAPAVPPVVPRLLDRKGQVYQPAVGPRLKYLLALLFFGFALLGATGLYLAALSLLNALHAPHALLNDSDTPRKFGSVFTIWMLLVHVGFGV